MSDAQTDTVEVLVAESAEGIKRFSLQITTDDGQITAVEPGALTSHFEVSDGGVGGRRVVARAVDFNGEARHITEPTRLVAVTFDTPIPLATIDLGIGSMVDHLDDPVEESAVRFRAVE